jgi:biopolymer transport protein ExbB
MKTFSSYLLGFAIVAIFLPFLSIADINDVEAELVQEVKQANKYYQQQIKKIASERNQLLKQLAKEELALKALSVEDKLITRVKDEQSLSVEKLQQRLQEWQQQSNYLNHLLSDIDAVTPVSSVEELSLRIEEQGQNTNFIPSNIALKNGNMMKGQMLPLGPVHIFISNDHTTGGLITQVGQQWQLAMRYDDSQLLELQNLVQNQSGLLAFDTTNNRSVLLSQNQESISEHLQKGGIWVIPILCFALIAFIIAVIKAISLFRLPAINVFSNKAMGVHQQKLFEISQKFQRQEREDLLFDQLMHTKIKIEKGLSTIAVTASIAPLLGLLGTVSGMIQTFKLMTLFGAGDANAVSGGISESLVTTELGLIVAIPSLVAHAIMSRRCQHYMAGLESYAVKVSHAVHLPTTDTKENNTLVHEVSNVA